MSPSAFPLAPTPREIVAAGHPEHDLHTATIVHPMPPSRDRFRVTCSCGALLEVGPAATAQFGKTVPEAHALFVKRIPPPRAS